MGKKWLRCVLAMVMIVAGLAGFLWEFTVVDNDMYTIVDTHYGNRIACHIDSIGDVSTVGKIGGENADAAIRKMVAGEVWWTDAYYSLKNKEYCVPGIEWLIEPILPEGTGSVLTFVSSDPSVATVDAHGLVTAVRHGTTTIAVGTFNGKVATLELSVFDPRHPTAIALLATLGGTWVVLGSVFLYGKRKKKKP